MRCAKCGASAREDLRSALGEALCERCHVTISQMIVGGMPAGGRSPERRPDSEEERD